ncbi:tRNA pseudouridine(55) synthase TruB [Granulosicoccus antarcticus]|uniref:tRNA pseudouridine synthase B n=1 Tax=Granulosicoccus antarcticus IMCC3135 TaxID=1192854 RepID=A0A2Z2NLX7_9GAMM|nr:tRNA pseudouridine(55) synthase TruB [Granulosicoccus antarcticus]ASJ72336.1 tRNA pseudouridine synthase B [Granulosicoccus antarcticus IMCC3135]
MSRRNRKGRAVHGILLLDKPAGGSSNHALQRAKRVFGAKKAGHTGSLDPLATGMLPICFGEATKLSAFLLDADKGYETTLQLGVTTNSADADGEVLETRPVPTELTLESFTEICNRFKGPLQQIPPMVSAIKIDGQRLYKLAREGKEVERPPRAITIHELEVLEFTGTTARLAVRCSKGTYIRSLVTDIGEAIGCGAHVAALRRTFVSPFDASFPMVTLETLEQMASAAGTDDEANVEQFDELLLPLDAGLAHLPSVAIDETGEAAFQRGQSAICLVSDLTHSNQSALDVDVPCRVYDAAGRLVGLGELTESGEQVAPRRVLQWE